MVCAVSALVFLVFLNTRDRKKNLRPTSNEKVSFTKSELRLGNQLLNFRLSHKRVVLEFSCYVFWTSVKVLYAKDIQVGA